MRNYMVLFYHNPDRVSPLGCPLREASLRQKLCQGLRLNQNIFTFGQLSPSLRPLTFSEQN